MPDLDKMVFLEDWSSSIPQTSGHSFQFMDFTVDPLHGPFLISGTTGPIWVEKIRPENVVRVAQCSLSKLSILRVLRAIYEKSMECSWGSIVGSNEEAFAYLGEYGHRSTTTLRNVFAVDVVIPKDLKKVGILGVVGQEGYLLIHDPSRSVAFVKYGDGLLGRSPVGSGDIDQNIRSK